jgi:hypothetical protein
VGVFDVDQVSQMLFDQRAFLEKGVLPDPGGLNQQTPFYVASMLTILRAESEAFDRNRETSAKNKKPQNDSKGT